MHPKCTGASKYTKNLPKHKNTPVHQKAQVHPNCTGAPNYTKNARVVNFVCNCAFWCILVHRCVFFASVHFWCTGVFYCILGASWCISAFFVHFDTPVWVHFGAVVHFCCILIQECILLHCFRFGAFCALVHFDELVHFDAFGVAFCIFGHWCIFGAPMPYFFCILLTGAFTVDSSVQSSSVNLQVQFSQFIIFEPCNAVLQSSVHF